MNLLLLEADELDADGTATVGGRRARHLLEVLRAAPGQRVRVGVVGGDRGTAEVLAVGPQRVRLLARLDEPVAASRDVLLLAVPRPKVLARMLEHTAAMGFAHLVLLRTWRVDKSHLQSRVLAPDVLRKHLIAGLEQGGRTRLPRVQQFTRFRPFVEDRLGGLPLPADRFCAHPRAATGTAGLELARAAPFALAIGPERGFVDYEVEQLARRGFLPVTLGTHPLRTEAALAALWGQLDLLRSLRPR